MPHIKPSGMDAYSQFTHLAEGKSINTHSKKTKQIVEAFLSEIENKKGHTPLVHKKQAIANLVKVLDATENKGANAISRAIRYLFAGSRLSTRKLVSDKILELSDININDTTRNQKLMHLEVLLTQSHDDPVALAAAKALLTKLPHFTTADYDGFSLVSIRELHKMGKVDISKLGETRLIEKDVLASLLATSLSSKYLNPKAAKEVINASAKISRTGDRQAVQGQLVEVIKNKELMGLLLKKIPKEERFMAVSNAGLSDIQSLRLLMDHNIPLPKDLSVEGALKLLEVVAENIPEEQNAFNEKEENKLLGQLFKAVKKEDRFELLFKSTIDNEEKAKYMYDLKIKIPKALNPSLDKLLTLAEGAAKLEDKAKDYVFEQIKNHVETHTSVGDEKINFFSDLNKLQNPEVELEEI
jgi:DNA repair protein RadC